MPKNLAECDLPVIEVPPELRGPSDEEILAREGGKDSPKRRRAARRPSKRERLAAKMRKEMASMARIAKVAETKPEPRMAKPAFEEPRRPYVSPMGEKSDARKKLDSLFTKPVKAEPISIPRPELKMPTSGRVLKGAFGANIAEKPKTVVVSAAELLKQRMEERAKKVREALMAKKRSLTGISAEEPATTADGTPVKRGRGRPRKNPIV